MSSRYDPNPDLARLQVQAQITEEMDSRAIGHALRKIRKQRNIRVLDVGCGPGIVSASRFADRKFIVTAVDKNQDILEFAKQYNFRRNINYICGDIANLELSDRFDLILCAQFLQHVSDVKSILRVLWSYLKPGGVIILRNSDDGMDINYPEIPALDAIIESTGKLKGISDRRIGRKLYTYLKTMIDPEPPVELWVEPLTNANLAGASREEFFDEAHSFRVIAAERHEKLGGNGDPILNADYFRRTLVEAKAAVVADASLISFSIQLIAFAQKL